MKLQRFEVESYMTLHENNCRYNLADTVAKSLTLKELLAYDKKDSLEDLMNLEEEVYLQIIHCRNKIMIM